MHGIVVIRIEPPRVDNRDFSALKERVRVVAVSGDPRRIMNNGTFLSSEAVEKSALSYVGASNNGDQWSHCALHNERFFAGRLPVRGFFVWVLACLSDAALR